jgi:hypothetical protein
MPLRRENIILPLASGALMTAAKHFSQLDKCGKALRVTASSEMVRVEFRDPLFEFRFQI